MTAVALGPNIFKKSYSRLLRMVSAVVALIAGRSDGLTKTYFSSN